MKELLSIEEAADFLGVKISWLRNAVHKNKIAYVKLRHLIRFKRSDLEEYIKNNTSHAS